MRLVDSWPHSIRTREPCRRAYKNIIRTVANCEYYISDFSEHKSALH